MYKTTGIRGIKERENLICDSEVRKINAVVIKSGFIVCMNKLVPINIVLSKLQLIREKLLADKCIAPQS